MVATEPSRRRHRWWVVALAALALGLALALLIRETTQPSGMGDSAQYQVVAEHPFEVTPLPYGYRILVPYLASAVAWACALPIPQGFLVVSIAGFVLVVLTIFLWVHYGLGRSLADATLLAALYAFSYAGAHHLHNVSHVGFYEQLILFWGLIAIQFRRFAWLAVIVFVGTFVNERPVVLLPLYGIVALYDIGWRAIWRTGVLTGLCLAAFALLRSGVLFRNAADMEPYASFYTWDYLVRVYHYHGALYGTAIGVAATFPALWPFAILGFLLTPFRERLLALLAPLAVAQLVFAADTLRMVAMAFPALLLLTANLIRTMPNAGRVLLCVGSGGAFYAFNYKRRDVLLAAFVVAYVSALLYYLVALRARLRAPRGGSLESGVAARVSAP